MAVVIDIRSLEPEPDDPEAQPWPPTCQVAHAIVMDRARKRAETTGSDVVILFKDWVFAVVRHRDCDPHGEIEAIQF